MWREQKQGESGSNEQNYEHLDETKSPARERAFLAVRVYSLAKIVDRNLVVHVHGKGL